MAFSWFDLVEGVGHEYAHVATAGVITTGLVVASVAARAALGKGDQAIVPASKVSLRGIFEVLTEGIRNLSDMVIGEHGRKFVPMFAAIFTFILINNLFGLIPGNIPPTENINTPFAIGLFVFVFYNFMGFKENGWGYLQHFMGPVLLLAPIMFVIELISHVVRPFSLSLRLSNVMMGDHTVVGIFLDLAPLLIPIPFFILGMFVSFVQAFVFTLLSMVYVAMATAHDH